MAKPRDEATRPQLELDDAIVLLLGAPSEARTLQDRMEGVTRLEKLVFLLERETDIGQLLTEPSDFEAHNFGPFSSKIYQAVDTLVAARILKDSAQLSSSTEDSWEIEEVVGARTCDPYATRNFELTERGKRYYQALLQDLPKPAAQELASFKGRFASLPLRQLIRYVYKRYPKYTEKSVIRDRILGDQ